MKQTQQTGPAGGRQSLSREERLAAGTRVSLFGIVANGFLAALKMLVGHLAGSLAIFADGLNNLFDTGSAILSLVSFRVSSRPSDAEHPFGHARFEYIASAMIGTAIIFAAYQLFMTSIDKIRHPQDLVFGGLQIASLVISMAVKLFMSFYYDQRAKALDSEVIAANAADARSDILGTGAILLALALSPLAPFSLDGPMSLAVSVLIFINGYQILRNNFDKLMGSSVDAETYKTMEGALSQYAGVLGVHDLILHDYGPGNIYLTASLIVDADQSVLASHDLLDQISHDLYKEYGVRAVLHMDPMIISDGKLNRMREEIGQKLDTLYPDFHVHDIQINDREGKHSIDFDLVLPWGFEGEEADLKAEVLAAVQALYPAYQVDLRMERENRPLAE